MNQKNLAKFKLPDKPGVYFFLKGKEILYIGKATSLKDRVKSYFGKDLIETRGPIILDMVFKSTNLKWQAVDSVLEALILEAELIKKHQPKYNTKEKSDKSFLSVVITKEKLPRVFTVRSRDLKENSNIINNVIISKTYGPFTSGTQLREALRLIRKIFPFLDDKSKNYLEFYKQINLVPNLEDSKLYLQNIKNIKLFFAGKKKQILRNLKKEMSAFAKTKRFEEAGELKRQIFALQHINDVALLREENPARKNLSGLLHPIDGTFPVPNFSEQAFRIEAYDIAHMSGKNMVGVMTVVVNGEAEKSEYKKFKIRTQADANDTGALWEVLERRLAHPEWPYPSLIVVDGGKAQINVTRQILSSLPAQAGVHLAVPIVSVLKDERHKARAILGDKKLGVEYEREILLANSEAHRFAIAYHKQMRNKNFLK